MPISRIEVRNVQTDMYRNVDREDPEAILNDVAVSGLIGILRQLGDLAEFAADIFHGIQEEIMVTASRSNQLKIRLQHIEDTVSPLEKAMLAQTSHIHFAYTGGLEWHPHIQNDLTQLTYKDLPHFIMDPYEECRGPPRLHLLDKFDINGPGSCMKRYSDPTYFKRTSSNLIQGNYKFQKDKKHSKIKKKSSSSRIRDLSRLASMANQNARKKFSSFSFSGQTSSSKTASTSDMEKTFDLQDHHSLSFDSRSCSSYTTSSLTTGEKLKGVFVSPILTPGSCTKDAHDHFTCRQTAGGSSCVSWDEKAEIVESLHVDKEEASEMATNSVVDAIDEKSSYGEGTGRVDFNSKEIENSKSDDRGLHTMESESESEGDWFVDALNTIESESENDQGIKTSQEVVSSFCGVKDEKLENSVCGQDIEQSSNNVEDSCRSMDVLMDSSFRYDEKSCGLVEKLSSVPVNTSDKVNHQDPQVSSGHCTSNISDGDDNITITSVAAPENSLSDSSNHLNHSDLQKHQKPEAEVSRDAEAIRIWTNGGILGLKPSKPPISLNLDRKTDERTVGSVEAEKDKSDDRVENASHVLNDSSLGTLAIQNLIVADQIQCQETDSRVLGLSQKLLTFCRKDSFVHARKTVPETIPENDEVTIEKSRFCNEETLMEPFKDKDRIASSPPLQYMKISLVPADTLQASRLKLKLSEGDNNYSTLYSFQLLPETTTSLPDSFSDDDSFCRSSPYMSDNDYLSDNQSLSNSEQWEESSNSHERKEQELYDVFDKSRHVDNNNAKTSSLEIESKSGYAEPLPPPFPPMQWMVSKQPSEKLTDKTQSLEDSLIFAFEKHIALSTINKDMPKMATSAPKSETKVHLKNKVSEKETEDGDFLQQIRTQQINLRPVAMTRSLSTSARTIPTINPKISAILEKANSIRQAVDCSDEDESDTWSNA